MEKVKILVYASTTEVTTWGDAYGIPAITHFAWTEIIKQETERKSLLCAVAFIAAQGKDDFDWTCLHEEMCNVVEELMKPTRAKVRDTGWQIREAIKIENKIFIDIGVL